MLFSTRGMLKTIILIFSVVNGVYLQNAVNKTTTTTTTTTANPDWEGTTDIPEEIEVGEDVTTNNASIPTTPLAHDPMEQNDFYNPTRRPKQIALVTLNAQTQPMNAQTQPMAAQTQPMPTITTTNIAATTTTKIATETEAEEVETEWTTTTQGENENENGSLPTQNTGSCPPLQDAVVEHHVILRHGDCEIVISQDDSIRWFNEPGKR